MATELEPEALAKLLAEAKESKNSRAAEVFRANRSFKYEDEVFHDKNGNPGVPLTDVIFMCHDRWSLNFLNEAKKGDVDYMLAAAEMHLRKGGYGKIKYNQKEGERWLTRASCFKVSGVDRFKDLVAAKKKQLGPGVPIWFEPKTDSDEDQPEQPPANSGTNANSTTNNSNTSNQDAKSTKTPTPASANNNQSHPKNKLNSKNNKNTAENPHPLGPSPSGVKTPSSEDIQKILSKFSNLSAVLQQTQDAAISQASQAQAQTAPTAESKPSTTN